MSAAAATFVEDYLLRFQECLRLVPTEKVAIVAEQLLNAYRRDKLVAIVGNGGSAATASHMACDLSKTILGSDHSTSRRRFRVMAMTDNVPLMTAWANDASYKVVFSEQIKSWVRAGDLVLVISASGNSPNICEAAKTARSLGAQTVGFLGFDGGQARELVDVAVVVPSDNYGYVEDLHMMLGHLVTAYIREILSPDQRVTLLTEMAIEKNGNHHRSGSW